MELLFALAALLAVGWLIAKGVAQDPPESPATHPESIPQPKTEVLRTDARWLGAGTSVSVHGIALQGGLLYVGHGLRAVSSDRPEPALVDPQLPVDLVYPDRAGTGLPYWASYDRIPPSSRAAYLYWLASGRRDPAAAIGYVFLYFYGLERRVLAEATQVEDARTELPAIRDEIAALLEVYGSNNSFRRYASQLLDVIGAVLDDGNLAPALRGNANQLPLRIRVRLAQFAKEGARVPAELAFSWVTVHPTTVLPTAARRCASEFRSLFLSRYAGKFGEGLVVHTSQERVSLTFAPASPTFGGQMVIELSVQDISDSSGTLLKLQDLADECAADLEAYSRWLGRNPGAAVGIAAAALLPTELIAGHRSEEVRDLQRWIDGVLGELPSAVCESDDLLGRCVSLGGGTLTKSGAVLLAQLLEKCGFGLEPDVRFGSSPLAVGGHAVLFRLPPNASSIPSPGYPAGAALLHLAVAVSWADGSVSEAEREHLEQHIERSLALEPPERLRLRAHLQWLLVSRPRLTRLKKRLAPLDQVQRTLVADFVITVAGADGHLSPEELRTLGKIYPLLGLPEESIYSRAHALSAGAPAAATAEPVVILDAVAAPGHAIPPPPVEAGSISLDMAAVEAKLAQSEAVTTLLHDIFSEEEPVPPPKPMAPEGKVRGAYALVLKALADRGHWTRSEFEGLVAKYQLLPDAVIDALNESAFEHVGGPVLEGDDPLEIDMEAAKELLA